MRQIKAFLIIKNKQNKKWKKSLKKLPENCGRRTR